MKEFIKIERSIHYASNEYHGKATCFDEITPMFIGYQQYPKPNKHGPHKRFSYVLHFINSGEGIFTQNGVASTLKKGDVFIVKPHVSTYYEYKENNNLSFAWIGFSGRYAKKLDDAMCFYNLKGDYYNIIKKLVDNNDTVYAEPVIELLLKVVKEILNLESSKLLKEVKKYLDENYTKDILVEDVASKFSYSRTYISSLFKKQYGKSIKEYIMDKRLTTALNLILNGKKISFVATSVGFNSVYNFSRYFKQKYGVSPKNY